MQKKGWLGVKAVPHTINENQYKNAYYTSKASKDIIPKIYKLVGSGEYQLQTSVLMSEVFTTSEADVLAGCFKADSWNSGTKTFIRDLFSHCLKQDGKNFFEDYLEPFFYEALRVNRGKNHYYKRFNCKIPFLNGGLFDPIENYEWDRVRFDIPNELFSNRHIKGDRDADGILDIFERYNFTMNEDEPSEREVAVDPEMLGKIFENLLDAKDRKNKGAFYTPREVVHYMCQESLCNFLVSEVNLVYEEVKDFIQFGEIRKDEDCSKNVDLEDDNKRSLPRNIYLNLANIDTALANIKVADPAVGSGAFPLGMLSEIVKLRNIITEYRVHKIPADKKFERKIEYHNRNQYKIKWDTIKNCIFAVDIESSAVDIAKLRLWLSLVVDQEVNTDTTDPFFANDDKDPHPLPNLDYNIMCGNSLIDEFEGIKLFDEGVLKSDKKSDFNNVAIARQSKMFNEQMDALTNRLFAEQEKFFAENETARKEEIKANITHNIDTIIRAKLSRDDNKSGLAKYEASLKEKTKPYFIWKLEFAKVFKEKGGFDVVIGNPPYVGEKGNKEIFRPIADTEFGKRYYQGKMDIFYFFFHKGLDIGNQNAEVSFITTNYFPTASGAKHLREDFKARSQIRKLINFNELKIFESALGQHNLITCLTKNRSITVGSVNCICRQNGLATADLINSIVNFNCSGIDIYSVPQCKLYDGIESYIRLSGINMKASDSIDSILSKIASCDHIFEQLANIKQGIVSGADKATDAHVKKYNLDAAFKGTGIFVIRKEELACLNLNKYEQAIVYKTYKNSQVHKYGIKFNDELYVFYVTKDIEASNIPNIINYLLPFRDILEAKRETVEGKLPWYCLHWPREKSILESPEKIVNSRRSKSNIFALGCSDYFEQSDLMVSVVKDEYKDLVSIKYLLALLNSKLYYVWLKNRGKMKGEQLELYGKPLSEIPIKIGTKKNQEELAALISQVVLKKKSGHDVDTAAIEASIDKAVYDLYGLSAEEKRIVEYTWKNIK